MYIIHPAYNQPILKSQNLTQILTKVIQVFYFSPFLYSSAHRNILRRVDVENNCKM